MLQLQGVSFSHPGMEPLFNKINWNIALHEKLALLGNNGTGKSTLLKIIAGRLQPTEGRVIAEMQPYLVPQTYGQFDHLTLAEVLQVDKKLRALIEILNGSTTEQNFSLLNDDWTLDDRCNEALKTWQLSGIDLSAKIGSLSGGQKSRAFLAGINIHNPQLVLLDEPTNHLDANGRELLYHFIRSTKSTLVVVSHDRALLNILNTMCELSSAGVKPYGGDYEFYVEQKQLEKDALHDDIASTDKALRKAKEKNRNTLERQQRLDSRGKRKKEKAGVAKIMMNTLRNKAENSTSKLQSVHAEKTGRLTEQLKELRSEVSPYDKMRLVFEDSALHRKKILITANEINISLGDRLLWSEDLSFQINAGERVAIKGVNGSGKTTLIKIVMGSLSSSSGTIDRAINSVVFIDQEYSLLAGSTSVFEQAMEFNSAKLEEHNIKIMLIRFLFGPEDWNKSCKVLSGGERMRLVLCCLNLQRKSPDMIILDEPTNNLDLQNTEILAEAVRDYNGCVIVISHDEKFLDRVGIERTISLQ